MANPKRKTGVIDFVDEVFLDDTPKSTMGSKARHDLEQLISERSLEMNFWNKQREEAYASELEAAAASDMGGLAVVAAAARMASSRSIFSMRSILRSDRMSSTSCIDAVRLRLEYGDGRLEPIGDSGQPAKKAKRTETKMKRERRAQPIGEKGGGLG